ncbi:hypothetical protein CEXT_165101 [Caerostris extrusa]|uniref:Uncharacterized protein n=1 Tax=Caerostris extrusa TaxID=172846 RepID=A0AAV4WS86_CAEEX|nr:hypothetical protein CEXT_165101 [Caerostris extrusa]
MKNNDFVIENYDVIKENYDVVVAALLSNTGYTDSPNKGKYYTIKPRVDTHSRIQKKVSCTSENIGQYRTPRYKESIVHPDTVSYTQRCREVLQYREALSVPPKYTGKCSRNTEEAFANTGKHLITQHRESIVKPGIHGSYSFHTSNTGKVIRSSSTKTISA